MENKFTRFSVGFIFFLIACIFYGFAVRLIDAQNWWIPFVIYILFKIGEIIQGISMKIWNGETKNDPDKV